MLKSAQTLKPSQAVVKGIQLLEEGKIERKKGELYNKNKKTGKCQMCVDGVIIRCFMGLNFIKGYRGIGCPSESLMKQIGMSDKIEYSIARRLTRKFDLSMFSYPSYTLELYRVLYFANDWGISWERIAKWLESIGK